MLEQVCDGGGRGEGERHLDWVKWTESQDQPRRVLLASARRHQGQHVSGRSLEASNNMWSERRFQHCLAANYPSLNSALLAFLLLFGVIPESFRVLGWLMASTFAYYRIASFSGERP